MKIMKQKQKHQPRPDMVTTDVTLTRDREALQMMKAREKKLGSRLIPYRLDSKTLIWATKDRLPALIKAHQSKR